MWYSGIQAFRSLGWPLPLGTLILSQMHPGISIIIPVFNVADWLNDCVDSILSQSFTDYEVLLIDDGSSDGSETICDEYAKKDKRIRVFHKANGGISSTRNYGLELAVGKWICFVDADDLFISPDALKVMFSHATDMVDLVIEGYLEFEGNVPETKTEATNKRTISRNEALLLMYPSTDFPYLGYVTAKLYVKKIIDDCRIRFDERILFKEDTPFVVEYLCHTNNPTVFELSPVYGYRRKRKHSITSLLSESYSEDYFTSLDAVVSMRRNIRSLSDSSNSLLKAADHEVFNRLYYIIGYMSSHGCIDKSRLSSIRAKLVKEIGIIRFIRFFIQRVRIKIKRKFHRILEYVQ